MQHIEISGDFEVINVTSILNTLIERGLSVNAELYNGFSGIDSQILAFVPFPIDAVNQSDDSIENSGFV